MYDLKCVGSKCPICGGNTEKKESKRFAFTEETIRFYINCRNKCYRYSFNLNGFDVHLFTIFGKNFTYDKDLNKFDRHKIINEIRYWKKNDRYLMELMK